MNLHLIWDFRKWWKNMCKNLIGLNSVRCFMIYRMGLMLFLIRQFWLKLLLFLWLFVVFWWLCYVLFIAAGIIACQHDILSLKKLLDNKINNMGYRMIILLMRTLFINLKWREEINFLFNFFINLEELKYVLLPMVIHLQSLHLHLSIHS